MIIVVVTTNMTREYDYENAISLNIYVEDQLTMIMKIMRIAMRISTVDKDDKNGQLYQEEG